VHQSTRLWSYGHSKKVVKIVLLIGLKKLCDLVLLQITDYKQLPKSLLESLHQHKQCMNSIGQFLIHALVSPNHMPLKPKT
jgi:hypothetical protein